MKGSLVGYNTVVLVLNDAGTTIRENADEFAEAVTLGYGAYVPQRKHNDTWPNSVGTTPDVALSLGNHSNPATVVSCHHSSETALILVGGNYATVLGVAGGHEHHKRDTVKRMLNDILSEYGLKVIEAKKG
jgi:hypothetical protein